MPMVSDSGLRVVDFFCGAGGLSCGFRQARIRVVAGIDLDERCRGTFDANFPEAEFLVADVSSPALSDALESVVARGDDELIFAGCSPCQFWSKVPTAREKSGASKALLRDFGRYVSEWRPGYVVVENVPGLADRGAELVLRPFLRMLRKNGYSFAHGVVSAADYGVPQMRRRFLLLATRLRGGPLLLPEPRESAGLTVRRFIGDPLRLPPISAGHRDPTPLRHSAAGLSATNLERLRRTPPNGGVRSAWSNAQDLQIPAYAGRDGSFRNVYGRVFWDRLSPTITTRFNSLSNGRFGHPEQDRALSLREGATLQTFPRDFAFLGCEADVARQIGNAVPPALAECVGKTLVEHRQSVLHATEAESA